MLALEFVLWRPLQVSIWVKTKSITTKLLLDMEDDREDTTEAQSSGRNSQ